MANPSQAVWDYTVNDLFHYQFFKKQDGTYKTVITLLFQGHNEQEFVPDLTIYDQRKTPSGELLNVSEVEIKANSVHPHLGTLEVHGNLKKLSIYKVDIQNVISTNFDPKKSQPIDLVYDSFFNKIENIKGPFRFSLFRKEGATESSCQGSSYNISSVSLNSGDWIMLGSIKVQTLNCPKGSKLISHGELKADSVNINGYAEISNVNKEKYSHVKEHCHFGKDSEIKLWGNFSAGELSINGKFNYCSHGNLKADRLTIDSDKKIKLYNVEVGFLTVNSPFVSGKSFCIKNDFSLGARATIELEEKLSVNGNLDIGRNASLILRYYDYLDRDIVLNILGHLYMLPGSKLLSSSDKIYHKPFINIGKNTNIDGEIEFDTMTVGGNVLLDKSGYIKTMSKFDVKGNLAIKGQINPKSLAREQFGITVSDFEILSNGSIDISSNKIYYVGEVSAGKEINISHTKLNRQNIYSYRAGSITLDKSIVEISKLRANELFVKNLSLLNAIRRSGVFIKDRISLKKSFFIIDANSAYCDLEKAEVKLNKQSMMVVPSKEHSIPKDRLQVDRTSFFTFADK